MKILHICTGWPLSFQGGITNYVRNLAQIQYKNKLDVFVLGAPDNEKYDFGYISYTSKIRAFSYCPLEDKKALDKIKIILEDGEYDVIHIHALEYVDWDLYEIIKGYHYVVSLHDYCFICPRVYMFKGEKPCEKYDEQKCIKCVSYIERIRGYRHLSKIFKLKEGYPYIPQHITKIRYTKFSELLNNADYILPVSNRVEEIYRQSGIFSKSRVLHIGNASAEEFDESFCYDVADHVIKICFLGRLTRYKGAELFIQIAEHMKENRNVEFHFLGHAGEYENRLAEAGIVNHGKYNQKDLKKLLDEFDMGMVLSIWEDNGPQVVMELMNYRIPVIGTRMGGISDFVTRDNGFIFDPYSDKEKNELYEFLDSLTPQKILELKKNINRTNTPQEHYEALMKVYKEVLE